MANNPVEQLADLYAKDSKRANWLGVPSITGTNDFGFIKVRHCEYVIPSTTYDFNFRSAYSSNPTISPVLSRAKVTVCGIWVPISIYTPALRDGALVQAMKTDYAFPTINFNYRQIQTAVETGENSSLRITQNYQYIPANSIFTELNMWEPYFTPLSRLVVNSDNIVYPKGKNAIPLLGYYDFFRSFILNNQQSLHPIRIGGFSRRYYQGEVFTQDPVDNLVTRKIFDNFFNSVRRIGNGGTALNIESSDFDYPQGDDAFDISKPLAALYFGYSPDPLPYNWAPIRKRTRPSSNDAFVYFNDDHFGEVRATYFSDFNTAYMSNDNVEYATSTARIKADDDGFITMEQIYAGERMQNFMRRSMFKESDYSSFIDAETGITPPTTLSKPLFLGSVSSWINYNDVIAQSQTGDDESVESNTSLGSRASLGFGRMVTGSMAGKNNRSFVRFTAKEPGFFMLLEWIVPEVSYWQGYNPQYDKTTLMSLYYPDFDRSGFQDQQLVHLVEQATVYPGTPGSSVIPDVTGDFPFTRMDYDIYNFAPMQVPAFWEHMTYRNRLTGQMVDSSSYLPWNFHRDYDLNEFDGAGLTGSGQLLNNTWSNRAMLDYHVTNTYVEPENFHNIYANTQGLDNIQCYYKFKIKRYQPLSHRFTSF